MTQIGLYSATENELGALQRAAGRLDGIELVVRSEGDLDEQAAVEEFLEELLETSAVVLWLHGGEDSMPGYGRVVERLRQAGVLLVVKSTGDAYALEDTSVAEEDRQVVYEYLEKGGTINLENCCQFLASAYDDGSDQGAYDDPVSLPTEGVYHPDHPGIGYEELLETFDATRPTVAVWFYESHWTHENTRHP